MKSEPAPRLREGPGYIPGCRNEYLLKKYQLICLRPLLPLLNYQIRLSSGLK